METRIRRILAVGAAVPLVVAVSACGANSTPEPSPPTTETTSPTDSPTAEPTSTATASPTSATGTPTAPVQSLVLKTSSTSAKPGERINIEVVGPQSLAGKQVVIVDMVAPDKYKIFSKLTLNSRGEAYGYVVVGVTDAIQAFVPTNTVNDDHWNPGQPVLAESGQVTINVQ
ncbi:MAG: hypothetical protein WAS05_04740 [Candidatus Nanopelagicales bacterium]